MISFRASHLAAIVTLCVCSGDGREARASSDGHQHIVTRTVPVTGSGMDHLSTAIVHSQETTPTGKIVKSTEIVELNGDLKGFVLYHVTSVFDFVGGTLVNTGDQVFSGTIAGSAPVMIHDDRFRFQVNLRTGEESGQVYLLNHIAGPKARCRLDVVGTGLTPEGNPTFDYRGTCTFRGHEDRLP
jgi:hypothetical protein